jgi:hypothetical protein
MMTIEITYRADVDNIDSNRIYFKVSQEIFKGADGGKFPADFIRSQKDLDKLPHGLGRDLIKHILVSLARSRITGWNWICVDSPNRLILSPGREATTKLKNKIIKVALSCFRHRETAHKVTETLILA